MNDFHFRKVCFLIRGYYELQTKHRFSSSLFKHLLFLLVRFSSKNVEYLRCIPQINKIPTHQADCIEFSYVYLSKTMLYLFIHRTQTAATPTQKPTYKRTAVGISAFHVLSNLSLKSQVARMALYEFQKKMRHPQ